jgi:hypothetical protein
MTLMTFAQSEMRRRDIDAPLLFFSDRTMCLLSREMMRRLGPVVQAYSHGMQAFLDECLFDNPALIVSKSLTRPHRRMTRCYTNFWSYGGDRQ